MTRTRWTPTTRAAVLAALLATVVALLILAAPGSARADEPERPVLLVGIPGLRWSDSDQLAGVLNPLLHERGDLAVGSLVVRSTGATACPVDGWLGISAGNRASDARGDSGCAPLESPTAPGWQTAWSRYVERADAASFTAEPGLLGDALAEAGVTASAIGAGAGLAIATRTGDIEAYQPYLPESAEGQVREALVDDDLVVVDMGAARLDEASEEPRQAMLSGIAEELEAILAGAADSGRDPVVLISGISDSVGAEAATLGFFVATGVHDVAQISSSSTRQPGYLLATDQHATLLDLLGLDDGGTSSIGGPMTLTSADAGALIDAAQDRERHAEAQRPLIPGFFLSLVLINLTLYAAVTLALRRRGFARKVADRREPVLRTMRVVSLAVAAIPVSSYLANLLPWWRFEPALLALVAGIAVIGSAIVALALLPTWRRSLLGPAAVVAGVTAIVLAIDVITGARLQVSAIMGIPTLVAGRFYGMNNTTFALFSTALLIVATAVANSLVKRDRRVLAAAVVAGIGIVGIVI
ncbi:hypothetical protein, partial [Pseudactinotalea sp.]|uniref:hypothetical protein n=1 Tax=Pseudactinotalea sp. TaxID=1926260 RepID=UPI003B3A970F